MNEKHRVFITGRSALTAVGATADDTWSALTRGESGLGEITGWDLKNWPYKWGGELKDYQPTKMLPDKKLFKVISRQDVLGINAAVQAVEHSGILSFRESLLSPEQFNEQTAVFVGSPGNKYCQQYDFLPLLAKSRGELGEFAKHLFEEVHPTWLLRILPNNVLAYTGITYGFKGPNHNITNHATGGTQAIIEAYHAIREGRAARAIVVAYDMGIEPQALFYYGKLGMLSTCHLKPFDSSHNGTLLADGAGALVLESEQSVATRGGTSYGEIIGGATSSEAGGLFSIEESGEHLIALITDTLQKTALSVEDIGLIVAHGNGNPLSDLSEACAIQSVFSSKTKEIPVTGFKWSVGHTLCASGAIDAVMTSYALTTGCIPGVANLQHIALKCAHLSVSARHQTLKNKSHALMISRGFASVNACLVIKAT